MNREDVMGDLKVFVDSIMYRQGKEIEAIKEQHKEEIAKVESKFKIDDIGEFSRLESFCNLVCQLLPLNKNNIKNLLMCGGVLIFDGKSFQLNPKVEGKKGIIVDGKIYIKKSLLMAFIKADIFVMISEEGKLDDYSGAVNDLDGNLVNHVYNISDSEAQKTYKIFSEVRKKIGNNKP